MTNAAVAAALAIVVGLLSAKHNVDAAALAVLSQGQSLRANDTLVSPNGAFVLRFFAPRGGDQGKRYLGIMYARAAEQTVPWVANRDAPVSASASYSATVTASGELHVLEASRVAWSTNTPLGSSSSLPARRGNVTLAVLDNGNVVLALASVGSDVVPLWQSFDHPADTFLPGMSIAQDRRGGDVSKGRLFTSWRSAGDPGTGDVTLLVDPQGSMQLYLWKSHQNGTNTTYWRSGQWLDSFTGFPSLSKYACRFKVQFDVNSETFYYTFDNSSSSFRLMLHPDGTETCYMLHDYTGQWEAVWSQPDSPCQAYNRCSANAVCVAGGDNSKQANCTCLKGFQPRSPAEYDSGNWTQGCVRTVPLACNHGGDKFVDHPGLKLPDFSTWVDTVADEEGCKIWCACNCSCVAYTYGTSIGCLVWSHDLLDINRFPDTAGYTLYMKVPASETGSKTRRWATVFVIVATVVIVALAASSFLLWKWRRTIKEKLGVGGKERKRLPSVLPATEPWDFLGPKQPRTGESENGQKWELPVFAFKTLASATGEFSSANKLGEGGFGSVYKGTLPGGEEIAVKRLSRSSGQGLEELKNEVILIAKLQHRNLVKLLGCCIQGEEKILVYEYMPNKSLDAFLFNPEMRGLLDWKTRLHIIEGIARGLLYLHRDSRLRVVHRDLKASNILLDRDMNPKISDFGMARIFGSDQNQVNTNRVVGTLGYMSPEYAMEGLFSVRSDVYSFGILVLEIISGQRNSSFHHMEGSLNIVGYAWQLWSADKGEQLIDPAIRAACLVREALRCAHLALLCVQDHACNRPEISYVVMALDSDSSVLPVPKPPMFTLQCMSSEWDGLFRDKQANESYSACDLTVTALQGR